MSVIVSELDLWLPMQSVPITTDVVSSNYDQGRLCNKVCQWLATGRWFSPVPLVSSTNKIDRHDINEILLKVKHHQTNKNKQTYTQDSFTFKQFQYILYNVGIKDCVPCLYIDEFWDPCCDVRNDFGIKTMFCSFLPPVVRRTHVLFTLFPFVCV